MGLTSRVKGQKQASSSGVILAGRENVPRIVWLHDFDRTMAAGTRQERQVLERGGGWNWAKTVDDAVRMMAKLDARRAARCILDIVCWFGGYARKMCGICRCCCCS